VRAVNTARGAQPRLNWSKGAVNLAAIRQVASEMKPAKAALKVLVCHHPRIETRSVAVTGGVHRGEAAALILAEAGIDLILTGHVHNPFAVALPHSERLTYSSVAPCVAFMAAAAPTPGGGGANDPSAA
jgi:hypothetical protein